MKGSFSLETIHSRNWERLSIQRSNFELHWEPGFELLWRLTPTGGSDTESRRSRLASGMSIESSSAAAVERTERRRPHLLGAAGTAGPPRGNVFRSLWQKWQLLTHYRYCNCSSNFFYSSWLQVREQLPLGGKNGLKSCRVVPCLITKIWEFKFFKQCRYLYFWTNVSQFFTGNSLQHV